ncbi:MAG TPA: hypothetical protein PK453_15395 [Leptospiraceae bacterium]|nr:hypothetical protein [Leptospiraceae bacterium]HMY69511.1 hypothetical protein [Leptospiraceae bacterium]HNF15051.1 hypothetical protein [Leptospiraceae bacterium]HNF27684.1 hypothetical protein [Leptospiraceae bacterium]HNM06523.1 hypothetical protein [Leptospiraceae bacterium]
MSENSTGAPNVNCIPENFPAVSPVSTEPQVMTSESAGNIFSSRQEINAGGGSVKVTGSEQNSGNYKYFLITDKASQSCRYIYQDTGTCQYLETYVSQESNPTTDPQGTSSGFRYLPSMNLYQFCLYNTSYIYIRCSGNFSFYIKKETFTYSASNTAERPAYPYLYGAFASLGVSRSVKPTRYYTRKSIESCRKKLWKEVLAAHYYNLAQYKCSKSPKYINPASLASFHCDLQETAFGRF